MLEAIKEMDSVDYKQSNKQAARMTVQRGQELTPIGPPINMRENKLAQTHSTRRPRHANARASTALSAMDF